MKEPEQLGVIAVVVIVVSMLVITNGFTVPPDIKQAVIGIPVGIVVALFVWYLTTSNDRKNRKYIL